MKKVKISQLLNITCANNVHELGKESKNEGKKKMKNKKSKKIKVGSLATTALFILVAFAGNVTASIISREKDLL
jgi:hypothetical protein